VQQERDQAVAAVNQLRNENETNQQQIILWQTECIFECTREEEGEGGRSGDERKMLRFF
jgi:hypothetical protein